MTPYRLLCGVTKNSFGGGVPALNNAVQGLADDGIVGGLDNCGQGSRGMKAARILLLQTSPLGNIAGSAVESNWLVMLVKRGTTGGVNPADFSLG